MTSLTPAMGQRTQTPLSNATQSAETATQPGLNTSGSPLEKAAQSIAERGWSEEALTSNEANLNQTDPIAAAQLKSEVSGVLFKNEFSQLANEPEAFHTLLQQTYGEKYDATLSEALRQSTLKGDFSYLPSVQLVDPSVLSGHRGAYSESETTIFLNAQLSPFELAVTFVEEVGHHLDTLMGPGDARGDEGEVFQRLLMGENPESVALSQAGSEDDHGIIHMDGKEMAVEFRGIRDFFKKLDDQRRDIGKKIDDWLHDVGRDIEDGFKSYLDKHGGSINFGVDFSGDLNNIGVAIGNNQINFDPRMSEDDRIQIDWEAIRGGRQSAGDTGFYGVTDEVFLENAYAFLLGRRPDPTGQTDYLTRLADGASQQEVLAEIYQSEEASDLRDTGLNTELLYYLTEQASDSLVAEALGSDYLALKDSPLLSRNTSDEAWLNEAYGNLLGRPADEAGQAYYLDSLRNNPLEAKASILQGLWDSGESVNRRLNRLSILADTMDPLFASNGNGLSPTEQSAIVVKEGYQEELRTLLNESRKAFMKSSYTPAKDYEVQNLYLTISETARLSDDLRKLVVKRQELESTRSSEPFYKDALDDLYGSLRPGARELLGVSDSLEHQIQDLDQAIALTVAEIQHNNIGIANQFSGDVSIYPDNYFEYESLDTQGRIAEGNRVLKAAENTMNFLESQQSFLDRLVNDSATVIAGAELTGELLKNRPAAKGLADYVMHRGSQINKIASTILEPIDTILNPIQKTKAVSDVAENLFDAYIQGGLPKEVIQQALEMPEGDVASARLAVGQEAAKIAALFSQIGTELDNYALSQAGQDPDTAEEAESISAWIKGKAAQYGE